MKTIFTAFNMDIVYSITRTYYL